MFFPVQYGKPTRPLGFVYDKIYATEEGSTLLWKLGIRFKVVGFIVVNDGCYGKRCPHFDTCVLAKGIRDEYKKQVTGNFKLHNDDSAKARLRAKLCKAVVCKKELELLEVVKKGLRIYTPFRKSRRLYGNQKANSNKENKK